MLDYVVLTKDHIVATDAHIIGWAKTSLFFDKAFIDGIPEEGVYIASPAWKSIAAARTFKWEVPGDLISAVTKSGRETILRARKTISVGSGILGVQDYPKWKEVSFKNDERREINEIGVDPHLITRLDSFLRGEVVVLEFYGQKSGIRARLRYGPYTYEELGAIIMPVLIE